MVVDIHCHVGQMARPMRSASPFPFERGEWEAYFSEPLARRVPRTLARWLLGVDHTAGTAAIDAAIEGFLLRHMLNAPSVDRVVMLAFDAYHDDRGRVRGRATTAGDPGTHLYVSNTYVRDLCTPHPEKLWFGASIHPYRSDAMAALDDVANAGAVLVKWLPLTQNIDAADPRTIAFLEHAGHIGMPLLIHYGGEMSLPDPRPEYEDPTPLLYALRRVRSRGPMPVVIVAHAATPSFWPFTRARHFERLAGALVDEFRDAPLYADVAALATWNRTRWLKQLLRRPELHVKLVHGSDFPVPSFPLLFRGPLGRAYDSVTCCASWIERDLQLKRALGLSPDVFTRMGDILQSLGRPVHLV